MRRTVVIVDDDEGFRRWAAAWLRSEGYDIVGEADAAAAAVAAVRRLRPDVALVDVQLPDDDGFDVARLLGAEPDPPMIVLISSREGDDYGDRVSASGARGFIRKDDLTVDVIEGLLRATP